MEKTVRGRNDQKLLPPPQVEHSEIVQSSKTRRYALAIPVSQPSAQFAGTSQLWGALRIGKNGGIFANCIVSAISKPCRR